MRRSFSLAYDVLGKFNLDAVNLINPAQPNDGRRSGKQSQQREA